MLRSGKNIVKHLYGRKTSAQLFNRLGKLDNNFSRTVLEIGYGYFWNMPGLTLNEKSLITISSLMALKKEEQAEIHLKGFFHTGGDIDTTIFLLRKTGELCGAIPKEKGTNALCSVLAMLNYNEEMIKNIKNIIDLKKDKKIFLTSRNEKFISLSMQVSLGCQEKVKIILRSILDEKVCNEKDIKNLLMHLIPYCGFPASMNGFSALKEIVEKLQVSNDNIQKMNK
ncbi:carboxymuconolactone decarboxylase family protein [Rickettsiella endosymbiont of Rhagonycha lignosa]|uniref:carboxymuconolactone decarboxylase family protein n=1 Tax=Rickettsiella endosymbiont of Rhagonycha lignosa TaxID=3077937 RepID=UPI00313E8344